MSVLYAPLSWRRWNNGRIQNHLARFLLLFTIHAVNAIVTAEAAADNNNNSSSSDIFAARYAMHKRGYSRHAVSVCHVRGSCQNE